MTDLRTGAAGGIALKYTTPDDDSNVIGFIGTGAIARNMARAAAAVRPTFTGVAYGLDEEGAKTFASEMSEELGLFAKMIEPKLHVVKLTNSTY